MFQALTLLIPIVSALIVGILTYNFAIKSKKFDLLYANKIPAFKDIATKLTAFKSSCRGKVAYYQGNEFSPYYESPTGSLFHRTEIAKAADLNTIFLSNSNREAITRLLNDMSILCNIELRVAKDRNDTTDYTNVYEEAALQTETLIEILYKDLNLK